MKLFMAIALCMALLTGCASIVDQPASVPPGLSVGARVGLRYHSDGVTGTIDNVRILETQGDWVLIENSSGRRWVDMRKVVWVSLDEKRRLEEKRKRLAKVEEDLQKTPQFVVTETRKRNPEFTQQVGRLVVLDNELKQMRSKYTEVHPLVETKREDLVRARKSLAATPEYIAQSVGRNTNPKYERLAAERARLEREIAEFGKMQ